MRAFSLFLKAAAILMSLGAVIAVTATAEARPPAHFDPQLHEWFESLKQPGTARGCCSESDCHILADNQWRETNNGYAILVKEQWFKVPHENILDHQPDPTGNVVTRYSVINSDKGLLVNIFCFIRGTET